MKKVASTPVTEKKEAILPLKKSPARKKKESPVEITRREASEKKRKRQDKQKVEMVKKRKDAIAAVAGKVGDLVSLKMDPREATKAQGIVGVVFETAANGTGGCRVVTEHGIISIQPGNKDYFIPCDRYKVLDPTSTIPTKLCAIRQLVNNKTFLLGKHVHISLTQAYKREHGRTTCGKKKCKCQKVCGVHCGCVKVNQRCHSGCLCNGNCANPNNKE